MKTIIMASAFTLSAALASAQQHQYVQNTGGPRLGYAEASNVKILTIKGKKFKDLNKNGKLDKYEDWRLPVEERAKDLAAKMTVEEIAGLMLYSRHQAIPAFSGANAFLGGTYDGKYFRESQTAKAWDLTDQQKEFLSNDQVRHVLLTVIQSPEVGAKWNNNLQAFVEGSRLGIPANNSSDPRHLTQVTAEFNAGAGGDISLWPDGLALGATFDPGIVRAFGRIAAREYRALGITTALSPQIDLATEPRWYRAAYVFSESPELTTDMGRAYIDGFQTSEGADVIKDGWGYTSVNAMVKHWPGGGTGEGGRDAHWAMGKYGVYPGNNFETHIKPFTEGAFKLDGPTQKAAAVMPYYTTSYNQDQVYGENVGNAFSKYIISDLLRDKYGYDGVVCTDWSVTADEAKTPGAFAGKPWGVEKLSVAERHYKALQSGADQFGGSNEKAPVLEAYQMGVTEHGEKYMRARFERSAVRLLKNFFRLGLFENPYLDVEETKRIVGNQEFMKAGYEAQVKSIVMLKNVDNTLPIKGKKKVYIPKRYKPGHFDWWNNYTSPVLEYPVDTAFVNRYFEFTSNPADADFALVFVDSPHSEEAGYSEIDRQRGGNGYVPIPLQYNSYTATYAREHSIAAGDPVIAPEVKDRSYKGKTSTVTNTNDLLLIKNTQRLMGGKPVVVSVNASKPMVFAEFERDADAILVNFNISNQAILETISGVYEPSGLLPVQMPKDMKTVEEQKEDVPFDMVPYVDSQNNAYDFGFGLNWSGVISDARTAKYKVQK